MVRYFVMRALSSAFALLCLLVGVFFVTRATGDPVDLYLPINATEEARQAMRRSLGLDQPLMNQFFNWFGDILRLDLGDSLWLGRPALEVALTALPNTLLLGAVAILLGFGIAVALGSLAALRPNGIFDRVISVFSLACASVPDFWLALMGVLLFSVAFGLLPTSGFGGFEFWVLPVAALLVRPLGFLTQIIRGSMMEALSSPFVRTAKAKGASGSRVLFVHGLRNGLLPAITVAGDIAAQYAGGGGIIEVVFGWPGIGKLLVDSILRRDFALIQACIVVVAATIFIVNIAIDFLYAAVDPRVELR
jgi:peptide/nickel transport system permease protein